MHDPESDIRDIPLSQLELSPANVRKTPADASAFTELKASIAAHGLLENLIARAMEPGTDCVARYAVIAGGRRLAAMQALAVEGVLDEDHPVPCRMIGGIVVAEEVSLAENSVRAAGGARTRPADGVACERAGLARRRGCVPGANRLQRHPAQQLPHARRGLRGERRGHHRRAPRGGHPRRRPARAPPRRPPVRTHPDRHAPDRARRRRRGARPAHPARGRGRRPGHGRRPRRAHRRHPHRRPASCLSGRHGRRGNDAVYSRFSSSGGGSRTSISGCSVTSSAGTNAIRMPHPA